MATLGFIGTGNIGRPMAKHILEAGHELVVHDRNPAACEPLLELGARTAESAREVAAACRMVFLSLPGPAEVELVLAGPDGILAGATAGDIVVDLSTSSIAAARRMAAVAAAQGVHYLDSPVTGGVAGAEAGTLAIYTSGDQLAFEKAQPVLATLGANVFYLGDSGTGALVKLINNMISLCSAQLVEEGLVLGVKAGLDPAQLHQMLSVGSSRPYLGALPAMIGRRFENPSFALALASKDVGLCLEAARELAVAMPVASAAHQTYLRAMAARLGGESHLAALKTLESGANVEVPKREVAPVPPPSRQ